MRIFFFVFPGMLFLMRVELSGCITCFGEQTQLCWADIGSVVDISVPTRSAEGIVCVERFHSIFFKCF